LSVLLKRNIFIINLLKSESNLDDDEQKINRVDMLVENVNSTGNFNSYVGYEAGRFNTTGSYNVAIGDSAGIFNTALYPSTQ
jgi:hypothetical protein